MWPRRKIQLLTPAAAQGIAGLQALLRGMALDFTETAYDGAVLPEAGQEAPFVNIEADVTDLMYAAGIAAADAFLAAAREQGYRVYSVAEFLRTLLAGERVLRLPPAPGAVHDEKFLLWRLLEQAGFEPSGLCEQENEWVFRRGRGIHWLLPDDWLTAVAGAEILGREPRWLDETVCRKEREEELDFYSVRDQKYRFIGAVPRSGGQLREKTTGEAIQTALKLGIAWRDIQEILKKTGMEIKAGWQNRNEEESGLIDFEVA